MQYVPAVPGQYIMPLGDAIMSDRCAVVGSSDMTAIAEWLDAFEDSTQPCDVRLWRNADGAVLFSVVAVIGVDATIGMDFLGEMPHGADGAIAQVVLEENHATKASMN